jgi:hypothetical protein
MWKLFLVAGVVTWAAAGCLDPGCMRNSECTNGLECRANKCQKPLPAAQAVAGQPAAQCYAFWCPYVQDGGQIHYGGSGGHAAVNTSTRYQDGGTTTTTTTTGASGMDISSATGAGAGGSM